MIFLLKYISLAIFKISEQFEKPYDSRIGFFSSVQCCSMAFTSILVAMKVLLHCTIGIFLTCKFRAWLEQHAHTCSIHHFERKMLNINIFAISLNISQLLSMF